MSAHPIGWEEAGRLERIVMVHTRPTQHSYAHWLIRIDPHFKHIVAISEGPVLQSSDFHLRGYFPGVLVVGSFHHVTRKDRKQACLRLLSMYGLSFDVIKNLPFSPMFPGTANKFEDLETDFLLEDLETDF